MKNKTLDKLLSEQGEQLSKLRSIVQETVNEEAILIDKLSQPQKEIFTRWQTISDKVALFGGRWSFIILFGIILFIWILYNTLAPNRDDYDPYPFILMNLILSCIAALQAPVIMMSQNRQEEKDRQRSENDYMINLKAELEVCSLHQKIDLLLEDQIKTFYETQAKQLGLLTDIQTKTDKIAKQLTHTNGQ